MIANFDKKKSGLFLTDTNVINKKNSQLKELNLGQTQKNDSPDIETATIKTKSNFKETKKLRENLYDKILFRPPYKEYYEQWEFTPGINFLKKLFTHDETYKYISNLNINIPETFCSDPETFYVYNGKLII